MTWWMLAAVAAGLCALLLGVLGRRHARRLVRERRLHVERFKLARKHEEIASAVFASPRVRRAIVDWARDRSVPEAEGERQARRYFREIVPRFNLLAYYRIGAPIARAFLNALYRVVVNRGPIRRFGENAPRRSVVVYVINHRSNVDYVLVAHMLFKFISLSYAVGEWARVWPLNHLFKWFGAYFIRRRFREPLYHAVLSEFVATITRRGVTQGIFIEGGLTRDGAWQKPKLGMLDYIVGSKRDQAFTEPLFLVPTAINYDRVLEDRVLTRELAESPSGGGRIRQLATTAEFLFRNALRSLVGRFKRYGYAIVTFGEPVSVDEFLREHPALIAEEFDRRKPALAALARTLMEGISGALPVTPVTLVARILSRSAERAMSEAEILRAIEAYRGEHPSRPWLIREHSASEIWRAARTVLGLRHLIELDASGWRWCPQEALLRDYYANSLLTYTEVESRGWAEGGGGVRGESTAIRGALRRE
ncbi:MAG TPA: 1-acyl-sn-glycerol-3-phosphate acyltransferase [Thermoanaerobaculia bacterium]|nr:1-acyl-sn-glycerol-3-phosphate acyltransferase [Thermoanaerobaculia bacterium]